EEAKQVIRGSGRGWSAAEWGFRWLYNQPEVTVVLSGMNTLEMVQENCQTASDAGVGQLTARDFETLAEVTRQIRAQEKVGCTGCRYCMPCPKGVDIPGAFRCYNAMYIESKTQGRFQYAQTVGLTREPAFATQCISCGKCEAHCPQNIPIRAKLKEADRALRPLPYRVGIDVARRFMFRKARTKGTKGAKATNGAAKK
ncbi:MAG: 4Fe-4S dicluster domain-containing protein, partial [Oscillospiraceae bacterium]|nr:4Fe-4S dicluster domain-containing protein [Oscillospiraceae bacterium]